MSFFFRSPHASARLNTMNSRKILNATFFLSRAHAAHYLLKVELFPRLCSIYEALCGFLSHSQRTLKSTKQFLLLSYVYTALLTTCHEPKKKVIKWRRHAIRSYLEKDSRRDHLFQCKRLLLTGKLMKIIFGGQGKQKMYAWSG